MQRILTSEEIEQKVVRLAHQIIENSWEEKEIFLGGIHGNGFELTKMLAEIIQANSDNQVHVFEIIVDKEQPWSREIEITLPQEQLKNGFIFLIDDVLNSGKTMQYALTKFLQHATKAIKTVAMVDRKHRRYPIKSDFVGLSLSTTLAERVEIFKKDGKMEAYLV
ncbi:MAG: phosphoribosyltransferase family protein [Crocinitomicaceae bacterium]|jgi:pyrimidine operon attenuation protein/uracil phosphoribosyltransferase|nr:phosphoribosyltransferase family protein [Crocinitomicaceae bacterium]